MKQIQSVFNYINLYIKSFRFVCRSSGKLTEHCCCWFLYRRCCPL